MYNKKKVGKIGKKGKHHSKNEDSCGINKTGFQKTKNVVAHLQQKYKCGVKPKGNRAKPAISLFCNPLFSKKGWKHVRMDFREEQNNWMKAVVKCVARTFVLIHPSVLSASSIAGLIQEDKVDIINVSMDAGLLANGIYDLIRYLHDFELLFSSIFDIEDKSFVGFLENFLLREMIYKGFQIGGLCHQLKNGRKSFRSFLFEIIGFACHLSGNAALVWEREKRASSKMHNPS